MDAGNWVARNGTIYIASVIFVAGMASKGLRLAKKQILFFSDILIPDGHCK